MSSAFLEDTTDDFHVVFPPNCIHIDVVDGLCATCPSRKQDISQTDIHISVRAFPKLHRGQPTRLREDFRSKTQSKTHLRATIFAVDANDLQFSQLSRDEFRAIPFGKGAATQWTLSRMLFKPFLDAHRTKMRFTLLTRNRFP